MSLANSPATPGWTCPFCALLCDEFEVDLGPAPRLRGSDCPRAQAGLDAHARAGLPADALVDGVVAAHNDALSAAASRLATWQQPLFGGLGTDVAGARGLYRLAARTQAICDHADGAALMHGVRALQDRGQFYTTLGELRSRADLVVCVGTQAVPHYPEFFRRCALGEPGSPCGRLVFLGVPAPPVLPAVPDTLALPGSGDLFIDLQQLGALVDGQRVRSPDPALAALAAQLREARYAVLVWEAGRLPAQGALLVEALNRIVATLNRTTRAATFALGGSDGAYSVNQVFTWLSGLPLRTRIGAAGLEHEPLRFDAQRLLAAGAVDGLLWIASFDPARVPPSTSLPRIVLGPPAMAGRLRAADALGDCVFVPVATPGLQAAGHLFRCDDGIVVPLRPIAAKPATDAASNGRLPGVDEVLRSLFERLGQRK